MLLPVVHLKTPRNSKHPWIYRKMMKVPQGFTLEPGALVEVKDKLGGFVGYAFYHPENTIALRLLSENKSDKIDQSFFLKKLKQAKILRESILQLPLVTDSYRLVNAEADGFPSLIIDKFNNCLIIEPYCSGWLHIMDLLVESLRELYPQETISVRVDKRVEEKEKVSFAKVVKKYPTPDNTIIQEYGVYYQIDFVHGHKTGFFLDQRDNRRAVQGLANKRNVLDLCCYNGGFALSAWKGGAKNVLAVDLDEKALKQATINARLNKVGNNVKFIHQDAFVELRKWQEKKLTAELVILDPPKLANNKEEIEKALKTYSDFNKLALGAVRPGGIFISCSCSGVIERERWLQTIKKAAHEVKKSLTIFYFTGPGGDHPVSSIFPEGQYLKVLFARVN